mmetsp:Transcript_16451/g.41595  ORF Transcript_16451/g.41595 Transcript_16451/m.41595 type:complete len:210 (-) Transcript_16451:398-1027(-)
MLRASLGGPEVCNPPHVNHLIPVQPNAARPLERQPGAFLHVGALCWGRELPVGDGLPHVVAARKEALNVLDNTFHRTADAVAEEPLGNVVRGGQVGGAVERRGLVCHGKSGVVHAVVVGARLDDASARCPHDADGRVGGRATGDEALQHPVVVLDTHVEEGVQLACVHVLHNVVGCTPLPVLVRGLSVPIHVGGAQFIGIQRPSLAEAV